MASGIVTLLVAQFAQQLKQKNPQYASMDDVKLVAAFLSKNPRYTGNYKDATLVSVSFEPTVAATRAQKPGVTSTVQSQPTSPATKAVQPASSAAMNGAAAATVVRPSAPVGTSGSISPDAVQPEPDSGLPSVEPPDLGSTVVVNAQAVAGPTTVGKYEIIDQLGQGGMGIVYKGFDHGIGRTVALKLMSQQFAQDTEFRARFMREARAAGILQHPNIVTVHELGEWQGAPFIAMEFLQGGSLDHILKNEKTMPLERRLDIIAQVCRGLDYAHARGIVHRDIKPANVMVSGDGVAKIVDFGIARLAEQKLTQTGHVLGTVTYMSPEQLQGQTLDGRSDIFAVGVMLFEVLTSVLPFAAENTGSAIANILYRQPLKLSSFLANYPGDLDDIIAKCLAKEPSDRFQTGGELADRISRVQEQMRSSQTVPTVVRMTTPATVAPFLAQPTTPPFHYSTLTATPRAPSTGGASRQHPQASAGGAATGNISQQLLQTASQSKEFAKGWWRIASPQSRRNAISIGISLFLYLIGLTSPGSSFSDSRLGGTEVTSTNVVLPVAILTAMIIAVQLFSKHWRKIPPKVQAFVGVVALIVAIYCLDTIALGLIWYVSFSKIRLILVGSLLLVFAGANAGIARDGWRAATNRERAIGALGVVVLAGFFIVSFAFKLSHAGGLGGFAPGGEYGQEQGARQAANAADTSSPILELLHTLSGHSQGVISVDFSPDGQILASGDRGGALKLWDSSTGDLIRTIETHNSIDSLAFSPDGRSFITATNPPPRYSESDQEKKAEPSIYVWDVATGQQQRSLDGRSFFATDEETRIAAPTAASSTMFNIWDTKDWRIIHSLDAHGGNLCSLSFGPGSLVATASDRNNQITIWNAETGQLKSTFDANLGSFAKRYVLVLRSSVVVAQYIEIAIYSFAGEQQNVVYPGCDISTFSVELNGRSNGMNSLLAVGCPDGEVKFWRMDDLKEMRPLQAHTLQINAMATNPRTGWLATASEDKTVRVWK